MLDTHAQVPEEKEGFLLVPGATLPAGPWSQLPIDEFVAKQNAELNNGRLAMIAIFLIVLQEVLTTTQPHRLHSRCLSVTHSHLTSPYLSCPQGNDEVAGRCGDAGIRMPASARKEESLSAA